MNLEVPAILFAFNRPDKLRALWSRLADQGVKMAYLYCDAARGEQDEELCEATQKVARNLPVELRIRPHNYGLSKNLISGISEVLSQHPSAMVFEDDVHPKAGCIDYLNMALDTYGSRQQIFSVGCYRRSLDVPTTNVFLSPRFNCWGWATWANRWERIQESLKNWELPFPAFYKLSEAGGYDIVQRWRAYEMKNKPLTWDTVVALHCLQQGWMQVQPSDVMIENVGFDGTGTNCGAEGMGRDGFEGSPQVENYRQMDPMLIADPSTLRAIQRSYADPRVTKFTRLRREWHYRAKNTLQGILR